VLPYYERDAERLVNMLTWIVELCGKPIDRKAFVIADSLISAKAHMRVEDAARKAFTAVHIEFLEANTGKLGWPAGNNLVFANSCKWIAGQEWGNPWLWLETDMVPCRVDWVEALETEYNKAGKPFMGQWVEHYDIMNGAGIYPPNVLEWSPKYLNSDVARSNAFDCVMAPDIMWFVHNATHLIPNVWSSRPNGRPGGFSDRPPEWTPRLAEWVINHNGALAHRCKDGKLIKILRERLKDSQQIV
jgi:hypothetical protein